MVDVIIKELALRKNFLNQASISSIYFGGGTPSLLNESELANILETIHQLYPVKSDAEITLEANPDDLTRKTLASIKQAGVNRLSIGVQTFDAKRLKYINRAHSAEEAEKCLTEARSAGFDNVTADLIYAIPPDDMQYWENDLNKMLTFGLPHLSIYGLTIEERTVFGNWAKKGLLKESREETNARQFRLAHDMLTHHGYEHYEVSNYAQAGHYSRHNSAYWDNQLYLGVGPGAHSYDGLNRSFNISHNAKYIAAIQKEKPPLTEEKLSAVDRANEYIFTHLRTQWGIDAKEFKLLHGKNILVDFEDQIREFCLSKYMILDGDKILLTIEGFMLADEISWRLFYDQE